MSAADLAHRRVVASLFGTIKLVQMYGPSHDATGEALWTLLESIGEAAEGGDTTSLTFRGARIKVNGRTVRAAEGDNLALTFLSDEFRRRQVSALHIRKDAGAGQVAAFVELFLGLSPDDINPADTLTHRMKERELGGITIEAAEDTPVDPLFQKQQRAATMGAYVSGLRAFRDVLRADGYPDRRKVRRARRAVQGLIDRFLEDEAAVLMLAQLRGHDVKLFHHSMNVSIYAMVIGLRIGMDRRQLGQLGLAALFHDLGKRDGETRAGHKARPPRESTIRGARMLLMGSAGHPGMLKAAITAYEQHAHYDRSGSPALDHDQHLVAGIIAIADSYDTLTSPAAPDAASPHEAFRLMRAHSGTVFDPVLLKVFVNALGIYPVGSLVDLSTGETALVTAGPLDASDLELPRVRVVDTGTGTLEKGAQVDLAIRNEQGEPVRRIASVRALRAKRSALGELVAAG
jgi:HD-GYP domain-containing protein (c-di-GMP phosphodiesterase class II)